MILLTEEQQESMQEGKRVWLTEEQIQSFTPPPVEKYDGRAFRAWMKKKGFLTWMKCKS